jgi:nucleoside-diphosphate-sugar epimerase
MASFARLLCLKEYFSAPVPAHLYLKGRTSINRRLITIHIMSTRVLLLGGHGKISLLMTPKLLARSWQVTSVIRNPDHESELRELAKGQPGKLDVLTNSLDDVKSEQQAQSIIDSTKPDYVIFSAGRRHVGID